MGGRLLYKSDEDFYAAQREKDKREKRAGMTDQQIEVDKQARENLAQYQERRDPESLTNVAKASDERVKDLKLTSGSEATQKLKDLGKSIASTDIMAYGRPAGSGVLLPKPGTHYLSDIGFPSPGKGTPPQPVVEVSDSTTTTTTTTPPKKVLSGETNVLNGGKEFVFGKGRSSGMNLSIDNSISNLGKNLQQNMDLDSKFDKTNNNVSSKTRGGLFGNYGKKVEIRKTFDESTGRTNKQKFIDGELASDRNARQDVRRKGRSTDARSKRKAGRNK